MLSKELEQLEVTLRSRFSHLDIRSDQCNMIRIFTPSICVGCRFGDGYYTAKVISLLKDGIFEDDLIAKFKAESADDLLRSLQRYLET